MVEFIYVHLEESVWWLILYLSAEFGQQAQNIYADYIYGEHLWLFFWRKKELTSLLIPNFDSKYHIVYNSEWTVPGLASLASLMLV